MDDDTILERGGTQEDIASYAHDVGGACGRVYGGHCDQCGDQSPQEEAYEYISKTFIKFLEKDEKISYEHKRSIIAFWEDLFEHEGVKSSMLQAFSNFLWQIQSKMDSARKAGIMQALSALESTMPVDGKPGAYTITLKGITAILEDLLKSEEQPDEPDINESNVDDIDLSEVGGGDEDDTPLI